MIVIIKGYKAYSRDSSMRRQPRHIHKRITTAKTYYLAVTRLKYKQQNLSHFVMVYILRKGPDL